MAQNKCMDIQSEFFICCQKTAMKVQSSSSVTAVSVLRRGPESVFHWTVRTVNTVDSSKQIKTPPLDSFRSQVRQSGGMITLFPNLSHSCLRPSPVSPSYEKPRAVRTDLCSTVSALKEGKLRREKDDEGNWEQFWKAEGHHKGTETTT